MVELLDPADPSLDGLWVNSNLDWEFDLDFIGPVTGSISIVNFEISDYGIDSNNFTRILGLTWDYIPSGDIADYQVIFMQGLQSSSSNFVFNSIDSSNPNYPFDEFALSGNYGWVIPGPDNMLDQRYLIFARRVLDSNNDPVLGPNNLPTLQIADVILMSLDATLTPVPEPASLGLLALGSSMMLIRRKRA
ncbi:MAG: PEP-CTERM sorting domain-containing protein [Phycisphaerales bacterium]|nr:PEP-CTERM sorting domain-containing protein [Phycisphaerales bacterium]